jgi:hypothetical protein
MLKLRHCGVLIGTPHSSAFASLAAGDFCIAIVLLEKLLIHISASSDDVFEFLRVPRGSA